MIVPLLLVAQTPALPPATPAVPWAPASQLACSVLGPIDQVPATFDLDLAGRKTPEAVIAASDGPFARVSSISTALTPAGGQARLIGIATGNAQYRLVLTPAATGGARLDVLSLTAAGMAGDRVMQGFCTARDGKRLAPRKLATLPATDGVPPQPAWMLQSLPQRLPDGACVLLGEDRKPRALSYTVVNAAANELTITYRTDAADLFGGASVSASGVQFHLVSPARRMVSVTATVGTADPDTYVHTAFERSGTWIDVTRGKRLIAVGACGAALPILVGPPIGAVSP